MEKTVARVAVNVQSLAADKLYDYAIPRALREKVTPGVRVLVPYGRGNTRLEALVLQTLDTSELETLKPIDAVLDTEPVLDENLRSLAVFLRDRVFCPLYTIVRAMLPAGCWFRVDEAWRRTADTTREQALAAVRLIPNAAAIVEKLFSSDDPVTAKTLSVLAPDVTLNAVLQTLDAAGMIERDDTIRTRSTERTAKLYRLSPGAEEFPLRSQTQREVVRFLSQTELSSSREIAYYTGASDNIIRSLVKKGVVTVELTTPPPPEDDTPTAPAPVLSDEQVSVFEGLCALYDRHEFTTALLRGVTGSGKTAVYLRLIEHVLAEGRSALLLVPEIALTPQLTAKVRGMFGADVAVLHSALSVRARYEAWLRIRRGEAHVVVGTRSAVFAPLQNLGLIIIDEEHVHTYKSDAPPRYHARGAAKFRCYKEKTLLLLGSATPLITSSYLAQTGEYADFRLNTRYGGATLPDTVIADTREAFRSGYTGTLGPEILERLAETIARKEQAILFLNRRGSSRMVQCMECGHVPECRDCSVPMAYHQASGRLLCHQCGYSIRLPAVCPKCGKPALNPRGAGTQAVEEELLTRFPDLRILRMDSDTTSGARTHTEILETFRKHGADVLLGTQMVAKGLDFANVTTVCVLDADMSLYGGDYTCAEETFALITQVTGRAGRGDKPGLSIIQTAAPRSDFILAAAAQDYDRFYNAEIALRQALRQPPFCVLVQFVLSSVLDDTAYMAGLTLREIAVALQEQYKLEGDILGAAVAPIRRLKNRYRYTLTLRAEESRLLRPFIAQVLRDFTSDRRTRGVSIYADFL